MRFILVGTLALAAVLTAGAVVERGDGPAPHVQIAPTRSTGPGSGVLAAPPEAPMPELEAVLLAEGLDRPTSAVADHMGRVFVTEKSGVIRVLADGLVSGTALLDLDDLIPDRRTEQGLLSMALHPDFPDNGLMYIDFTDEFGDTRIIEYRVVETEDGPVVDLRSSRLILRVDQPGQFHNGGMLQFGPDGYLFASFGDGHFGEPARNARDTRNVLGTIVRLDVDVDSGGYAVPASNPFVGSGAASEIWITGLRNPWRFFVDPVDRLLVIGDVGQFSWEEVTVVPLDHGGLDLGWPIMEAEHCYSIDPCDPAGLVLPTLTYGHSAGCAVIGGPVYRGNAIPELRGMVVYADFCTGFVRAFGVIDGHVVRRVNLIESARYGPLLSLAVDADGEILLLTQSGELRRLQPTC